MNPEEIDYKKIENIPFKEIDDKKSNFDVSKYGNYNYDEFDIEEWNKYVKSFKKKCHHKGEINIFGLVPISCDELTTEKINTLIKEKNIKTWCILDLSCLLRLDIDKLTPVNYYFEPIQDFSVPSFEEMNNIIEFLHENSKKGNILVTCMAGHGRTGMVLSIWAGLNGIENPISYIRKEYCNSAVETVTQEMFVNLYLKYIKQL